ncbi:MAG: histidine phosphatase family protein [Pseudomonadales bacterium]|nr:histidine phosphatase family protein [Pseudomonadales bacterium]
MRRLTLLRHAQAEPARAGGADRDRPLDRRGRGEAAEMANRLAEQQLVPDRLLISPASRTRETTDFVLCQLALDQTLVLPVEALYLAEAGAIPEAISRIGALAQHLMIVAHNPGLSELAQQLAPDVAPRDLPTAGMVTMLADLAEWSDLAATRMLECRYDHPAQPA